MEEGFEIKKHFGKFKHKSQLSKVKDKYRD